MKNQPILYHAQSTFTLDTYLEMNRVFTKVRLRKIKLWYYGFLALIIIQFIISRKMEDLIFLVVMGIAFPLFFKFLISFKAKRYYNQSKIFQNKVVDYSFFEDSVEIKQDNGEMIYNYTDIYRLIITKSNLYLSVNGNQALIIEDQANNLELVNFLKDKSNLFNAQKDKIIEC
ncbi:YcxB family protein [Streptococcus catagoni]|uniref:YcxB family protein n=1 Tax=Streptococcus catagoni TaxID=2654874 RepID=UPI00140DADB3|nr:YcxB family protein [Streptococcus catagoni]